MGTLNISIKQNEVRRGRHLLVVAFLPLLLFPSAGPPVVFYDPIELKPAVMTFEPTEFYIAEVIDDRADKAAVAYLLSQPTTPAAPAALRPVDLKGGGLIAIRQYLHQNLPRNPKLRPVVIRLKEFRLTENAGATGRVDGLVRVAMDFEYRREGKNIPLLEYRGGARYDRPASQLTVVEPVLRQALVEALQYLNTWMNEAAPGTEILAKGIKVNFTDYVTNTDRDTVFYSPGRPLAWDDFQGNPRLSRYGASIFPGFSYDGKSEVIDGIIHVNLDVKVYMVKEASWVKPSSRNPYGLNHEQRHFDLVRLVAERFKNKIHPDNLTLEDYNSIIQYQFIESYREMNRLQEQYDLETRNGLDLVSQARWNHKIEEELRALPVRQ